MTTNYKFYDQLPHCYHYYFGDGERPAKSLAEFLNRIKKLEGERLRHHLASGGFEKWLPLREEEKTKFCELRKETESRPSQLSDEEIRQRIIGIMRPRRGEAIRYMLCTGRKALVVRLIAIAALFFLALIFQRWFLIGALVGIYLLFGMRLADACQAFKPSRVVARAVYDHVRYAFYTLMIAVTAMLSLAPRYAFPLEEPVGSLLVCSLLLTIVGIVHVVNLPIEETGTTIELASTHWFLAGLFFFLALVLFACAAVGLWQYVAN